MGVVGVVGVLLSQATLIQVLLLHGLLTAYRDVEQLPPPLHRRHQVLLLPTAHPAALAGSEMKGIFVIRYLQSRTIEELSFVTCVH